MPSATALVRQCIRYSLGIGLTGGLMVGLTAGRRVGDGYLWLRYAIGVRRAARQGVLP